MPDDSSSQLYCFPFQSGLGKIYMTSSVYLPCLTEHTHGFVELLCITSGCGIHTIDGHSTRARRGDMFLIDYGVRHSFHPLTEPFTWINCIFRPEYLCDVFSTQESAARLLEYIFYHNIQADPEAVTLNMNLRPAGEDVSWIFEDMLRESSSGRKGSDEILEHYLMILLTKIARRIFDASLSSTAEEDSIGEVLQRLESAQPGSLSAKELADSYFMSPSAFSANFRKRTGIPFLEYVTRLRIRRACELLLTSGLTVGEVQSCAGYADAKAFSRAFRKYTGMTPSQYRNTQNSSEDNS